MVEDKFGKARAVAMDLDECGQFRNEISTHGHMGNICVRVDEEGGVPGYEISKVQEEGYRVAYLSPVNGKLVFEPTD